MSLKTMKAAVMHKLEDIRYEEIALPTYGDDEVLVKVMAAGICGSDTSRVFKKWKYPLPAILGHEFSGEVVEFGADVKNFKMGERVIGVPLKPCFECENCLVGNFSLCDNYSMIGSHSYGAFAQYIVVQKDSLLSVGDMDFEEAAMIEPLAVALHGIFNLHPKIGDTVAVLGCGALGQYVIQWLKISGVAEIVAIDISDSKLKEAVSLGATHTINAMNENVEEACYKFKSSGMDITIECAGSKITQEQSLLITAKKGLVGYLGIAYSDITLSEKAFENIFRKELTIKGIWNSYSAPFPGKEWTETIRYIKNNRLKLTEMISHRYSLDKTMDAFNMIKNRTEDFNKVLILPWR